MFVKQVSIFVDNKKGSIAEVISILGESNINIKALSVADAADFGILRLIVDEPERAYYAIKEKDYNVKIADTLGIEIKDEANELAKVLNYIKKNDIEVTYIYSVIGYMKDHSVVIIKTPNLGETYELLKSFGVKIVNPSEIYKE
ncbi:acetolactate synthase [bacterium]|nr:acetolactate synthase [bacterium]